MKTSDVKDYLKCVVANKATLAGYMGLGAVVVLANTNFEPSVKQYISHIETLVVWGAGFLLGTTHAGLETLKVYRRTKIHIEETETIEPRFTDKLSKWYCTQVGARLAAREAGLEHLIK